MSKEQLTPLSIAIKYVHGHHGALTDDQEVKDMVADIETLLEQQRENGVSKGLSIARKWYKIGLVEAGAIDEGDFDKYWNEVHMPNILKEAL